ncbi:MAG: hypothetical protein AB7F89_16065 [Pirellulaceae bacterium]
MDSPLGRKDDSIDSTSAGSNQAGPPQAGRPRGKPAHSKPAASQDEPVDPTPAEIRASCEKFQATWSEKERRKRVVVVPKRPRSRKFDIEKFREQISRSQLTVGSSPTKEAHKFNLDDRVFFFDHTQRHRGWIAQLLPPATGSGEPRYLVKGNFATVKSDYTTFEIELSESRLQPLQGELPDKQILPEKKPLAERRPWGCW